MAARDVTVGVIGLGYVGLPLAVAYARRGFRVVGVDVDGQKVAALREGRSYIQDVPAETVAEVVRGGLLRTHTSYAPLRDADGMFICVPTPCTRNKEPDTSMIAAAGRQISRYLRPGQLVILRSTSYPGTTEELLRPLLEAGGHRVGRDIYLAFAPERVDPGSRTFSIENTPAVVGGCDPESTARAVTLLESVVERVVPISSPAAAEMTKLLENVYRNVNIALVNQVAMLCDRMGLSIWEIIEAAATKPYGFQSFSPGPGVGGHCIPVDPYYLAWKAREFDFHMDFIELAARINDEMPYYVAGKVFMAVNGTVHRHPPRMLVIGVTFKRDVDDYRASPALKLMELLVKGGAGVDYHDPYVATLPLNGKVLRSRALTPQTLRRYDCVIIATDHSSIDYELVVRSARRVFDTRNATAHIPGARAKVLRL